MAIDVLGSGQTRPIQAQANHGCPIPATCCLHLVLEADGGSHHVCGATDDFEGKIVLGAALLVPTLVPGHLLACKGGAGLEAMVLALQGDTGRVPEGLNGAGTGVRWATKGAKPGPASCMKEACPGAGTSCFFEVYGSKAQGGVGRGGWGAGCCSGCEQQDGTADAAGIAEGCLPGPFEPGAHSKPAPCGFSARSFPILGQGRDLCHAAWMGPTTLL